MQQVPLLQTKLHMPPIRPELAGRPRLIERLTVGLDRKLTLVSAPAGFGKTTLVSEWVQAMGEAVPPIVAMGEAASPTATAWLSLDESDNDLTRFLTYFTAALGGVGGVGSTFGGGTLGMIRASQSQPPLAEAILTSLINEMVTIRHRILLVLDDYHTRNIYAKLGVHSRTQAIARSQEVGLLPH